MPVASQPRSVTDGASPRREATPPLVRYYRIFSCSTTAGWAAVSVIELASGRYPDGFGLILVPSITGALALAVTALLDAGDGHRDESCHGRASER
ncbi:hypothetical protein AGMMS50218_16630 [Actinomycetota bacterium]|nr:hypothetical protein AGMMS50218_16630 [Actinomycetota bacterium]